MDILKLSEVGSRISELDLFQKKPTFNERPLQVLCVSPMVMLRMSQHEMDDKMQQALASAEKSSLGIIPIGSMHGISSDIYHKNQPFM